MKVEETKISIIVLTFNNYNELLMTLNSVPKTFHSFVFVENGGSCLNTRKFLEEAIDFKGVSEKDSGISDAFSKGVKKTSGKYVHFLNSGDKIHDQSFYQEALRIFESDSSVDYVYSNILYKHLEYGDLIVTPNKKALKNIAFGMPFPHPGLIVKRDIFDKIGYFSDQFKIGMDYDFILRMIKENFKGTYLNLVSVEMEGTGISSRKPILSTMENFKSLKINNCLGVLERVIIGYRLTRSAISIYLAKFGLRSLIAKWHKKNQN